MGFIQQVVNYLHENSVMLGSLVGFLMLAVSKLYSTEKASLAVKSVQKVFDAGASGLSLVGDLLHSLSDLLANLIKSDGAGGLK